jgi:hypothetical protein
VHGRKLCPAGHGDPERDAGRPSRASRGTPVEELPSTIVWRAIDWALGAEYRRQRRHLDRPPPPGSVLEQVAEAVAVVVDQLLHASALATH